VQYTLRVRLCTANGMTAACERALLRLSGHLSIVHCDVDLELIQCHESTLLAVQFPVAREPPTNKTTLKGLRMQPTQKTTSESGATAQPDQPIE
jgi:hypothetical protein